eukprot:7400698-Pyramimonas_sp.AAC.1
MANMGPDAVDAPPEIHRVTLADGQEPAYCVENAKEVTLVVHYSVGPSDFLIASQVTSESNIARFVFTGSPAVPVTVQSEHY